MKKKFAQELVEFLLVAPFLMIIFGILTEYAYALNINYTLTNGLKTVSTSIYSQIKPGSSASDVQALLFKKLSDYLNENNIPNTIDNDLTINIVMADDTALLSATYKYIPAFTLPMLYIDFLPSQFNFHAIQTVPAGFLMTNTYDSTLTSRKLDAIWTGQTIEYSSMTAFTDSKNGIMSNPPANTTETLDMLFLVPADSAGSYFAIVKFDGSQTGDYLIHSSNPTYQYYIYNIFEETDGEVSYTRTATLFKNKYPYPSAIFVIDPNAIQMGSEQTLSDIWASSYTLPIYNSATDGLLKMTLAVADSTDSLSVGNFDNLEIDENILSQADTHRYISALGSTIIVCPNSIDIQKLIDTSETARVTTNRW